MSASHEKESGETLGSTDTDASPRKRKTTDSSDDDDSSIDVPLIIIPKKRNTFKLVATGNDAILRMAKAINESRRTGRPLNKDIFIPPTTDTLLHELSLKELSTERMKMIMQMSAVERECEFIANGEIAPRMNNIGDLRRLLRVYDDFAMRNIGAGEKIDDRHRLALFITRMKVVNSLAVLTNHFNGNIEEDLWLRDHYWRESLTINNIQLARWMYANRACHPLMLVVEDRFPKSHPEHVVGHLIQYCTIECFWQSMLAFAASWPRLPMSGYIVKLFDEMRTRAAFFMSYRELAVSVEEPGESGFSLKKKVENARSKILGLNLNLFGLMDMNNPEKDAERADQRQQSTLLDNVDLVRFSDNYVHANLDFAEECDRLLHSMHLDLRRAAGFRHSDSIPYEQCRECIACSNSAKCSPANIVLFEALVEEQVAGTFRTQISQEFRELVFQFYEQPNELTAFREYHGFEVITAQNCIQQQRPRDYKLLTDRFLAAHCDVVWQSLKGDFKEPAYVLLCFIAMNFYMQQTLRGARISTYFADVCKSAGGVAPYEHIDERAQRHRNVRSELHVEMKTTGTFRFRNKLINQQGMLSDREEIEYQHPLIVRSLNSVGVVFNNHLHKCESFAHAFLMWIYIMCTDPYIEGQLATGAFLHQLYARLFPERTMACRALAERADRRLRKYNPLAKFIDPAIEEAKAALEVRNMTQF
jgi:hypothetical protein